MIDALLQGILSIVIYLVNLLLVPIDYVISSYLPNISEALEYVNNLINELIRYVGLVMSYTGLTPTTINLIISISIFIYTVPVLVHGIKLSIKWYKALRG